MTAAQLKSSALIIIDMQNDFVLPGAPMCVAGALETVPRIRQVLNWYRAQKSPVFHVHRTYRADGSDVEQNRIAQFKKRPFLLPDTEGSEIVAELTPLAGEFQILKKRFSAFMQTELDFILRRQNLQRLVICGTQYPVCIRATIFDGLAYGYELSLLTDATSAQTPEIARANILDIQNLGVECLTTVRFLEKYG